MPQREPEYIALPAVDAQSFSLSVKVVFIETRHTYHSYIVMYLLFDWQ